MVIFHSEFRFGGMNGRLQIPVTRGYWLFAAGGGGDTGYGFGEIGLRVLVAGNGRAGSRYLSAAVGGAGVFKSQSCVDTEFGPNCAGALTYGGPMVGFGYGWRF